MSLPAGTDASVRDLVALRHIPTRVAVVTAGLVALTAASFSSGMHLGVGASAAAAVPTVSPAVAEALATLATMHTRPEPLDDELLQLPLRGPLGSTAILR